MKYELKGLALAGALLGAAACSADRLQIPNYNSPTTEGVAKDPQGIQIQVTGMLERERAILSDRTRVPGIFAREAFYYFPTDARWVSNPLIGIGTGAAQRLDPGGFVGGRPVIAPTARRHHDGLPSAVTPAGRFAFARSRCVTSIG